MSLFVFRSLHTFLYSNDRIVIHQISRSVVNRFGIIELLLFCIVINVNAIYVHDVDPSALIIPQQHKLIEQEKLNREIEDFKNRKKEKEKGNQAVDSNKDKSTQNCFTIKEVKISENTILSRRDIVQAPLKHLNTCNIEVGSKDGLSKINIDGTKRFPVSIYADTDTIGQRYTGHTRYTVGSRIDNPLKLGDSLNLKYISTRGLFNSDLLRDPLNNADDDKYSRNYISSFSIPVKLARIGINSSYSTYLSIMQEQSPSFRSSSSMASNSFFVNEVVCGHKSVKTILISTFNLLSSKNYINDALSDTKSRNLANMEVGIMNNFYTSYSEFFHKLTYIRGLNGVSDISDISTSRFYDLYNIKTDKIFDGKLPFTVQNTINAQYAWQDVYSQNHFVLGGFYSIRGFKVYE